MLKSESLQYRISDLEKKINLCLNNAKNLIQKGNKNGAKPWLQRKKNYEKYKQNCENIHLTLVQRIIDIKNAEGEKNLTQILKSTNQVYKNIGMENDKFIEASEDLKELNLMKEEMYEGIKDLVGEENEEDIENEIKKLEFENKKQENQNIEFPKVSEVPTNPFTEEEQQLYQQK